MEAFLEAEIGNLESPTASVHGCYSLGHCTLQAGTAQ